MKPFKTLSILLLLAAAISASAQSISARYIFPFYYGVPVECDGVADILEGIEGTIVVHDVYTFKGDELKKIHFNLMNDAWSVNTGEKFKVLELSNQIAGKDDIVTIRYYYNCIGEWGTRIKVKMLGTFDLNTGILTWEKFETTCK